MIPYSSFDFFYIIGILLIPAIYLGIKEKSNKTYNMILSLVMVVIIFSNSKIQSFCLISFFYRRIVFS